ncbi:MAG TPA: MoxR family ATPase [Acidimicrobiales bacterium]|nr:MoxR family ATPase [Acidimicrobiales bacterium]
MSESTALPSPPHGPSQAPPAPPRSNSYSSPVQFADLESTERLAFAFERIVENVELAYLGNDRAVRLALACLMAEGHLLVEDRPGVGKTTLAKALARSVGLGFRRVQFTADLLPSDVTGSVVLDRDHGGLAFRRGPVFTNVLLADELNRASPKAQSALLEAMEERQVSSDGATYALPRPFMVLATQNPFDSAGTFPLPHSQRDRFLLRVSLGYPDRRSEEELLGSREKRPKPEDLPPACDPQVISAFAAAVKNVHLSPEVRGFVVDLVASTRSHPELAVGASPRAGLAVLGAAAAIAVSRGRSYVIPDDVKDVAEPALGHRVVVQPAAELAGVTASGVVEEITSSQPVPIGGR